MDVHTPVQKISGASTGAGTPNSVSQWARTSRRPRDPHTKGETQNIDAGGGARKTRILDETKQPIYMICSCMCREKSVILGLKKYHIESDTFHFRGRFGCYLSAPRATRKLDVFKSEEKHNKTTVIFHLFARL